MPSFATICFPVALAAGAAGAYVAADRAVLAEIGLRSVGRELVSTRAAPVRSPDAPRRAPVIRQGGPVCYDYLLWPADGGPLVAWPDYVPPAYGNGAYAGPSAFTSLGGYGQSIFSDNLINPWLIAGGAEGGGLNTGGGVGGNGGPTPVPEPASIALFLMGLAGLAFARRRRRI